ncbi:MAG: PAS domain S-box protein [Anaerolineae bacterium]|nr:PAS domain S-box protein [Anaerolineae bacterium]
MAIHPALQSQLVALGLNEHSPPDAQAWGKLLDAMSSVYDQRDNAQTRFDALFEQNNDAVFLLDLVGGHQHINQQASSMLGYDHDKLSKLGFRDVVVEREHDLSKGILEALLAGENLPIYERTFRHKDGREIPTEINVNLIRDNSGKPLYIQSVIRDISQRKARIEQLNQSEARFRKLITHIPTGILLQGPKAEMLLSNPKALELLGLTEDQLLGKTSFDPDWNVIHEDGSPFPGETHPVPQAIATRQPMRNVVMGVYRPTTASRVWLLVNAEPMLNPDGSVQEVICTFSDITPLKQVEAALQSSEQRLQLINHSILDLVIYTRNGVIEYISRSLEKMTGYRVKDWTGRSMYDWLALVHPDDVESLMGAHKTAREKNQDSLNQYRFRCSDGQYIWIEVLGSAAHDGDVESTGRVYISRNITERKESEKNLKESENRLRDLLAEAERQRRELALLSEVRTIIGREMNIDALIRIIVETIAEKFGYTHTSLYLLHGETLVLQHYVGYDQVIREIPISTAVSGRVVRNREPALVVNASDDPDFIEVIGSTRSMVCVPLFNGNDVAGVYMIESPDKVLTKDDLRLLIAMGEHISLALERAQLYTYLEEGKLRYQTVVDNIHDVIFQLDTDGRWTFLNPAWEDTTGYPVESSLGQSFRAFIHPDDAAESGQRFKQLVNHQLDYSRRRLRYLHRDGHTVWMEVRVWPLNDIDGTPLGVSGTLTDISSHLQAEERALEVASQARTVEALKHFLNAVSHDLRTPLSVLNTSTYLIRRKVDQPDKLIHHIDVVEQEIAHLSTMVEDMVEMSKVDEEMVEFRFIPLYVNDVVRNAVTFLEKISGDKNCILNFVPDATIPVFKADSDMLYRAIKKLIQNSLQYTPDGGEITVTTKLEGEQVHISVADTGIGIDAEDLPHIFERFYKGDKARTAGRGGVGLGLAFVKKIAEAHGGRIGVESTVGKGSTFTMVIPLAAAE